MRVLWRHGALNVERPARGGLLQFGIQGTRLLVNEKGSGTILGVKHGQPVKRLPMPNAREVCAGAPRTRVVENQLPD